MIAIIFRVKIPIPESDEYKEFLLNSREEVCEFLKISQTTFYSILNNKMKFRLATNLHLKGITIEKTVADIVKTKRTRSEKIKPDTDLIIQQRKEFVESLIKKTTE